MGYVEDFITNAVLTHAVGEDKEERAKCLLYYEAARKEVKEWLKKVLLEELSIEDYTGAYVKLYLPLGDIEVRVEYQENDKGYQSKHEPELYYTPIGIMDSTTHMKILGEENNPVKMLYNHLYMHTMNLRILYPDYHDFFLYEEALKHNNISDVLGLHKFEGVFCYISDFLSGKSVWS